MPAPLRRAPFRRLTLAWSASNLADSALYLMLAIWVKELTGSDAAAGIVFLFLSLPALIAPVAGRLADAMSRRTLMVITNGAVAVAVLCLLAVRDAGDLWLIYAVTTVYGAAQFLIGAAQSGLLRDMLPDEELAAANGLFSTIDQGFRIISPLVGAGLFAAFGPRPVVLLTAVCFAAGAAVLLTLRMTESGPADEAVSFASLWSGFRLLLVDAELRLVVLALGAAFGITGLLNIIVFPLIEQGLGLPPAALGPIQTVQGLGAIIGGITAATVIGRIGERRTVSIGVSMLALALIAAAAAVISPLGGTTPAVVIAGIAWLIGGTGIALSLVAAVTLRMRKTPAHQQGRASSAMNLMLNLPQTAVMGVGALLILWVDYRVQLVVCALVLAATAAALRPWRRAPIPAVANS